MTRFATEDGAQALKSLLRGILWAWRSRPTESEKQAVLTALYRVKFSAFKKYGICGEFHRYYHGAAAYGSSELWRLFRLWPKYSGSIDYPIPGSYQAFWFAQKYGSMWSGEYGKLRKELLNFMIEQLEKELAK